MASYHSSDEKKAKELLEAASSGNLPFLKEVAKDLNKGNGIADAIKEIKDANGDSAFHLAAYHGRTEICHYFLQDLGFPVDFWSQNGETPLLHASKGGHAVTARHLINHGANPVVSDKESMTPLHYAAQNGQPKLVRFLISSGVPVDIEFDSLTSTPLTTAALYGQARTMEVLLERHADVNAATGNDYTPLYMTVCAGSLECTKLLVKAGADVNFRCPLARAVPTGVIEIIKYLLEAGADPNLRNFHGWLPIEIAAMHKKLDIVEMLFPLTSPVPQVHDWSVQGILQYVQSNAFNEKTEENLRKYLAELIMKAADSFKKKEYRAAIPSYSWAIEIDSEIGSGDAALFSNRSLCWHRIGEGHQALKDALMAHKLKPEWPKAHYRIGAAMMLLEKYEEASQAFKGGLLLDPTNMALKKAHREAVDYLRRSCLGEESK
ncbi:ankyrin repeat family protein [Rhynchospora pubera]|uniref:Ankyrin repeat family protein n=1 Tax=Rhynchospora pubera TaxID=906938 RepID=A0AAV8E5J0_9POAL|nr:ankyrin repeat family protein [Rhynchospora pubera]